MTESYYSYSRLTCAFAKERKTCSRVVSLTEYSASSGSRPLIFSITLNMLLDM
jgi:hypothetical protein